MTRREQALNEERIDWMHRAINAEVAVRELMQYLNLPKFQGDGDFVHISTDLYPKLREILNAVTEPVPHWTENM